MSVLINYYSNEQELVKLANKTNKLFDNNIALMIENYIYQEDITYYNNGAIKSRCMTKFGNKEGEGQVYYKNCLINKTQGLIKHLINYKDGEFHGKSESFYKDGQRKYLLYWDHGKRTGTYNEWRYDGSIKEISNWKDGELHGLCQQWENGVLTHYTNWKDGKLHGMCREWWSNGNLKIRASWKDGLKNGLCQEWWSNGQIYKQYICKDNKEDGNVTVWYSSETRRSIGAIENGNKMVEGEYKDGVRNGKFTWWYANGEFGNESIWENGICVRIIS